MGMDGDREGLACDKATAPRAEEGVQMYEGPLALLTVLAQRRM